MTDDFGASVRLAEWEALDPAALAGAWGVPAVHAFGSVGSTNDVAHDLAAGGAPEGTVVLAEEQRKGRGRAGRSWASPAGLGLWLSVVGRPDRDHLQPLPIRVGVEAARALDAWAGRGVTRLKWPNDLLLDGRKVGGILCEASWLGSALDHVVVGIGLNLLHAAEDFPPDLRSSATSLAAAAGIAVSRFEVAGAVVGAVRAALGSPGLEGAVLAEIEMRDTLRGRWVEVREPETDRLIASGQAVRIDERGCLLLRTGSGEVAVASGTVRVRPDPT